MIVTQEVVRTERVETEVNPINLQDLLEAVATSRNNGMVTFYTGSRKFGVREYTTRGEMENSYGILMLRVETRFGESTISPRDAGLIRNDYNDYLPFSTEEEAEAYAHSEETVDEEEPFAVAVNSIFDGLFSQSSINISVPDER